MRRNACPSPLEQTRQFSRGADRETREHLEDCEKCTATWASWTRVVELGKNLPDGCPSTDRVEAVRNDLLVAAAGGRPLKAKSHRNTWLAGSLAAGIALLLTIYFSITWHGATTNRASAVEIHRGSVHAQRGAEHSFIGAQPDEIVRLTEGTITVEVKPLQPDERFRVITGDAEVEVRGTAFDVTVRKDSLIAVYIISGHVEVRPAHFATQILRAGEHWVRPEHAQKVDQCVAEIPPIDREHDKTNLFSPAKTERARQSSASASLKELTHTREGGADGSVEQTLVVGPAELAFNEGWHALRNGTYLEAARAFERAIEADQIAELSEDASYWRAVSFARAGADRQAIAALRSFLAAYPHSPRRGEASTMLGWKLLDAGELDRAELYFRAQENDPVPEVRASAKRGLAEIKARQR